METSRGRWRALAVVLTIVLLAVGCGSPTPSPSREPTGAPGSPAGSGALAPTAEPSGPAASSQPTDPSGSSPPGLQVDVPADIAADVAALDAATTREAAVAATRTILERSGVVITDDLDAVEPTSASMYLTSPDLELLADEALSVTRLSRATFADFATTFGGIAGVTGDESYLDLLEEIDLGSDGPAPSPPADAGPGSVNIMLGGVQERLTATLSTWVQVAGSVHAPSDVDLAALTAPALYLQAFAAQQDPVLDLRQPFLAGDLELDSLEITILVAGLRSMLSYAQAPDLLAASPLWDPTDDVMGGRLADPRVAPAGIATVGGQAPLPVDCDGLKHLIDSHAPLSGFVAQRSKESIKNLVKSAIDRLFGAGTWAARQVGAAFKVLGVLFKVLAVVMLYEHAVVKLEISPAFLHKPIGSPKPVTAHVVAGIPDAEWNTAKAQRENDPWSTAVKLCARFLGVPVTSDLVDIGEGVKSWVVRWEVTRGLGHVLVPVSQLVGSGITTQRLERPLRKRDDHSGEDQLTLEVQPEREEDHPGTEHREPVTVCAKVVPREPPGGFKTLLGAGFAGSSLAGGASIHSALVTVVAGLLTAWYREVAEIKACEVLNVMFHVPDPGTWRGTIRVETEVRTSLTSVIREREPGSTAIRMTTTEYEDDQLDVTDVFYVAGDDALPGEATSILRAHQATHGVARYRSGSERYGRTYTGCLISDVEEQDHYGTWGFTADGGASLSVSRGGSYRISWFAGTDGRSSVPMPGETAHVLAALDGRPQDCPEEIDETTENEKYASPTVASSSVREVQGVMDPTKPDRLTGSTTVTSPDGTTTTKITWDLRHQGPIRTP